ncbi:hypothetical protein H2204_011005 [Knufia peltigerae]|uniref:Uncharacterized protein n=1 Tax=Knufia peltigerae TaxID=1002370 RepID=A0AA38XV14_9EURO|nr:hypothetical protein H2204_011005 [Knufia peltigerae]
MSSIAGKIFALTGAASGIGRATAQLLISRGGSVCCADINEQSLNGLQASLPQEHRQRLAIFKLDVGNRDEVSAFINFTLKKFGRLDGFANVAAIVNTDPEGEKKLWEVKNEHFRAVYRVNVEGVFNCLAEVLKPGVLPDGASIVNVASYLGLRALPNVTAYGSSKHAVVGLTKIAAFDAAERKIRVNAVAPGVIDTPLLRNSKDPNGKTFADATTQPGITQRLGQPAEVAQIIAFLLSDESSFVNGAVYAVDGGWNV